MRKEILAMSTSDYQFWLTANGSKSKVMLPVNPEKITVKRGSNNDSINIIGVGEVTIIQDAPADKVSFSSFFPATYFPGCKVSNPSAPMSYVNEIMEMKESASPIHFTVTSLGLDDYYTIESFDINENGGDVGTVHYSIMLKLYREVTIKTVAVVGQTATVDNTSQRISNTTTPKTYTVKKGDSLWKIAKQLYGNGSQYTKIYNANTDKIKNPNLIYPGQVLAIPD
jgi:nucleoid-associated protein YgaU